MNIYAIIILATLLVSSVIEVVAEILNLKALSPTLPEEFRNVYDPEEYRRSQKYTLVKTRFGWITSAFDLLLFLAFWFAGGFPWLDGVVTAWGFHPILTGVLFIGILVAARELLDLPFDIYSTFVIEEKFGFNKTTVKTFVLDILKGIALAVVIGGPLLAGILAFFLYAGPLAWLYCWIVVTVFMLVIQYVAPTWIMPLFNKYSPIADGELKESITNYAHTVKFPLKGVFVMDGSRRSSKTNAFFMGFGKNKRIALYDTLIEKHTVSELVSVLAHEIGHYKKKHIIIGTVIGILQAGILLYLLSLFITSGPLAAAFYMDHASVYTGLIFFGYLYAPVSFILSIFLNMFSRKNEYAADRYAIETYEKRATLIDALKKLAVTNLSNVTPHPFYVFLNYSHPTLLQRIEAMRVIINKSQT